MSKTFSVKEDVEKLKEENDIEGLMEVLTGGDFYGGIQAVFALGEIGTPAIKPLMSALLDGHDHSRWGIAMALARVGPSAVDPLIGALEKSDPAIRNPVVWALAEIGDKRVAKHLISFMQSENDDMAKSYLAAALLKLNDPAGLSAVYQEFERSSKEFKDYAMEAYEGS